MQVQPDVLAVLSDLQVDGTQVRIPGQLDRQLYTKVNKVLEACGGKWSRRAKAHVFGSDAAPRLDLVMTTGEVETGQDVGFFETPAELATELVRLAGVSPGDFVLEPSAGRGRIVEAIQAAGGRVTMIEWLEANRQYLRHLVREGHDDVAEVSDCMLYGVDDEGLIKFPECAKKFDRVVMNPPFCKSGLGDHLDHVNHCHQLLRTGGVLVSVLPSSVTFRRDRRYREFREFAEAHGGVFSALPEGSFKESGTGVNTVTLRLPK